MSGANFSTPMAAIDATVIDTETTGLDAATARIVQIGAVKIEAGQLNVESAFDVLVNPGVPIPPATSAVHGIVDKDVADAPGFGTVGPRLQAFVGNSILIGHTIGYDLFILQREAERAGLSWRLPPALDIRILAEVARPNLAQYDLDSIAAALGVTIAGRHTAWGDAKATAEIFVALVPLLRERGIRTIAEAAAASRDLADRQAVSGQRGFAIPGNAVPLAALARIDSFPYRHRLSDVMSSPPIWCAPDATIRDALKLLMERRISSVLVETPNGAGIVTERDLLRAIDGDPAGALSNPVAAVASVPLHSLEEASFVYRAIGRLGRLGVRHLAVTGADGAVLGLVTTRDLLRQRASTAILLGDSIDAAVSVGELGKAWSGLAPMARSLLSEEVDPRHVAAVISEEIVALTRRAAQIAELRMAEAGHGDPPCGYAVLVLGSVGRGESLLAADQDNAIVFAEGEPGGVNDRWFATLGGHVADILDGVGVTYCKGGVMARNDAWRHSVAGWRAIVEGWIRRQRPEDLLNVDIFFDGVVVHGDTPMGEDVLAHAFAAARGARDFLVQLALLASRWQSPVGWLGGLKAGPQGRLDLKLNGLMPIFTAARVMALQRGIRARSTPDRLRAAAGLGIGSAEDIDALIEAHRHLLGRMLEQQLIDLEAGVPPSPRVELRRLGRTGVAELKEALGKVAIAVDLVSEGRA